MLLKKLNAKYIAKFRISLLTIGAFLVIFINNSTRHAIPFFGSGPRRVFFVFRGNRRRRFYCRSIITVSAATGFILKNLTMTGIAWTNFCPVHRLTEFWGYTGGTKGLRLFCKNISAVLK